ncbi:MAG: hypothetical protein HY263_03715 [Chloroflexi bacterium]|nr:hypothetical protein [Chloroflexota bacterium]
MSARRFAGAAAAAVRTIDGRFLAWTLIWTAGSLLAFGVLNAIIPTPFFARPIAPEPFAIVVWIVSAPLVGLVAATYSSPARADGAALPLAQLPPRRQGGTLASVAGFGTFLAIGCPACNKVALIVLGTSGALSIYAPLQPLIGALSLGLLVVTVGWRFRLRADGGACPT